MTPKTLADESPTIVEILAEIVAQSELEPSRVIVEIDTLSTLRLESRGPYAGIVESDGNGLWRFADLPLTLVARRDVPARGWSLLTRK